MKTIHTQVEITYDDTVVDPLCDLMCDELQLVSPELHDVVATCHLER